jgi:hypothetical protein
MPGRFLRRWGGRVGEVKIKRYGAAEAEGWLGLSYGCDHGRPLGHRDRVVRVIYRLGNGSFDLLSRFEVVELSCQDRICGDLALNRGCQFETA